MIRMHQIKLHVSHTEEDLRAKICKILKIREHALLSYEIKKQSLDARKKPELYYVYTVDLTVADEPALRKKMGKNRNIIWQVKEPAYHPKVTGEQQLSSRPVVIGTGPAGLFCGYQLALMGYRPILLERGKPVDERMEDVERFWTDGILDPESNVQFGEGGAGTFSDGKLNTLVNDKYGRNGYVLRIFIEHGASQEILYQNKPHIGTDVLIEVVRNMRNSIIRLGGELRFSSKVTDLQVSADGDEIRGVRVENHQSGECYLLDTQIVIFAVGHSARDTFSMLQEKKVPMEAKSFAVGVRVEHPQKMVDTDQYGIGHDANLPAAAYKLTHNQEGGRGVYTFCMCPGGYVVNASSEPGRLAVNGMSYHARRGANANSAVIVTVTPEDYPGTGPLSGMEFQRALEEAACLAGKGKIPVQLFGDYCRNQSSSGPGSFLPQIKGAYQWGNVREIFPSTLAQALEDGIKAFDRKLSGYAREDAILSGVESRTSSPVRILRGDHMQSSLSGLYPCGEGAGYAGGITSAAMDGLKVAETIAKLYQSFDKPAED